MHTETRTELTTSVKLKDMIKKHADIEGRSVNNFIRHAIRVYILTKKGYKDE